MKVKRDLSIKRKAFRLYCTTGNVAEVARQLDLKRHTVYTWYTDEKWEERKKSIQDKLVFHKTAIERCDNNYILKLYLQELQYLDYLQSMISEILIADEIRPQTWSDVLKTQKHILERREKLLTVINDPKQSAKIKEATAVVDKLQNDPNLASHLSARIDPTTDEDQDDIDE